MKDCQFNDTFGEVDRTVRGGEFDSSQNAIYENCQFNNTRGGVGASQINGVHWSDAPFQETQANGVKFINCQFNGAAISPENPGSENSYQGIAGALMITSRNVVFEKCQACNMKASIPNYPVRGFYVGTASIDPLAQFGSTRNCTFSNCTASDLEGMGQTVGFFLFSFGDNQGSIQSDLTNMVVENCIAERIHSSSDFDRVAGILEGLSVQVDTQYPYMKNLYVRDCRVSDVRSNASPLSAGILVESVQNPVIENNSVSDCERGILFTGTREVIPNAFQLAATRADALAEPPLPIDIDAPVGLSQLESFTNKRLKSTVEVLVPDDVDTQHDFLSPTDANLTALHWVSGDKVVYKADGGLTIPGLVDGQAYYAIVYRPGFSKRGLVQNNSVTNCSISGYQDDLCPTKSAWINNMALLNGSCIPSHEANFAIKWPNKKPQVDEGTLGQYPKCPNKNFNTSLIYAKKHHRRAHSHR